MIPKQLIYSDPKSSFSSQLLALDVHLLSLMENAPTVQLGDLTVRCAHHIMFKLKTRWRSGLTQYHVSSFLSNNWRLLHRKVWFIWTMCVYWHLWHLYSTGEPNLMCDLLSTSLLLGLLIWYFHDNIWLMAAFTRSHARTDSWAHTSTYTRADTSTYIRASNSWSHAQSN